MALAVAVALAAAAVPPVVHNRVGDSIAIDGALTIKSIGKKQNYNWSDTVYRDQDVFSPKSVNFHPDGSRFYVNSLEGGKTVVYDAHTTAKLRVIEHRFDSGTGPLWAPPSGYYNFTHYKDGASRAFMGKPVESAFSHGGRYLWVPYYRRTFDLNAQDPSAVAIIDTRADTIVRMMETGPLPKMIRCSNDGRTMAITHWGDNTVGLVDISGDDPTRWHHLPPVIVERQLQLNFSLSHEVNRDSNSGLLLRGTLWLPGDRYLLVSCMGGSGGIAVIDVPAHKYLGRLTGMSNARHLIADGGNLYMSCNSAGLVCRVPLDSVNAAISRGGRTMPLRGITTCRVGGGARTIEASPGGQFVFAACNSASGLYVIDTRTMTCVGHINIDSYPVGLDISRDGSLLVVTSQARDYHGGNAVNLLRVTYAHPVAVEPLPADTLAADTVAAKPAPGTTNDAGGLSTDGIVYLAIFLVIALLLLATLWMRRR